ncbi:MAG: GNAT family N-acetyltransferase [Pyrinomonadaceae bacterium]|nr:GNAT family N-acetyltransferase [Pyrinomonadaceae bacterium]
MANQARTGLSGEAIDVRECTTVEEFDACIELQREVFDLPDLEISPRRHLIVTRRAGGWTLGAFDGEQLAGFVHQMVAVRRGSEIIGYSHMMAVKREYQNRGLGALLKWRQREKSLDEGKTFITWTWDPMQARNAHFNLNRLGVVARSYGANFYGTDYSTSHAYDPERAPGIDSDRLFADWELLSPKVAALCESREPEPQGAPAATVEIPPDWYALIQRDAVEARREQLRVRREFQEAFSRGLICAAFERDDERPRYLLYESDE